MSTDDKRLEGDDPAAFADQISIRAEGHAPGYDIAVYARPTQWRSLAYYINDLRAALAAAQAAGDEHTSTEDIDRLIDEARAEGFVAAQATGAEPQPGTVEARLAGICDFVVARGLCAGIEAKPPELFLMEEFDRRSEGFAAGIAAAAQYATKINPQNECLAEGIRALRPPSCASEQRPTVEQIARLLLGRRIDTWNQCLDAANAIHACASEDKPAAKLMKRPIAWRVSTKLGKWIIFQDEKEAYEFSESTCATIQGMYVRDGTPLMAHEWSDPSSSAPAGAPSEEDVADMADAIMEVAIGRLITHEDAERFARAAYMALLRGSPNEPGT